jgi:hypothetical protein
LIAEAVWFLVLDSFCKVAGTPKLEKLFQFEKNMVILRLFVFWQKVDLVQTTSVRSNYE